MTDVDLRVSHLKQPEFPQKDIGNSLHLVFAKTEIISQGRGAPTGAVSIGHTWEMSLKCYLCGSEFPPLRFSDSQTKAVS